MGRKKKAQRDTSISKGMKTSNPKKTKHFTISCEKGRVGGGETLPRLVYRGGKKSEKTSTLTSRFGNEGGQKSFSITVGDEVEFQLA